MTTIQAQQGLQLNFESFNLSVLGELETVFWSNNEQLASAIYWTEAQEGRCMLKLPIERLLKAI